MALLELEKVRKSFYSPDGTAQLVLDLPELHLDSGEQVGLAGSSGSGKTTLLHCIAGILLPDSGKICVAGEQIEELSESERDAFRARHLGYVFQTFHLLQGFTALENVLLGMMFGAGPDRDVASGLLERLQLQDRLNYLPAQLSVGQQQRVALARALAHRPQLVLADEPTGNLDPESAGEALRLIQEVCREQNAALLLVSHDPSILAALDRVENLADLNRAPDASKVKQ